MLTVQWFNENIPEKVQTYEDYKKVADFLTELYSNTRDTEEICNFINNTDDKELAEMSKKVWNLVNSFLDFCTSKYTLLGDFLKDNRETLSSKQAEAILKYSEKDVEASRSIAKTLSAVVTLFEVKKERK